MNKCKIFLNKINNSFNHKLKINDEIKNHLNKCSKCLKFYSIYSNAIKKIDETINLNIENIPDLNLTCLSFYDSRKKTKLKKYKIPKILAASFIAFIVFVSLTFYLKEKKMQRYTFEENSYILELINDITTWDEKNFISTSNLGWFSSLDNGDGL